MITITDDTKNNRIFISLNSSFDDRQLLSQFLSNIEPNALNMHRMLSSENAIYLKSLIFLFLTCNHIYLLNERNSNQFNVKWIEIFKCLQTLKIKLIPDLFSILQPIIQILYAKKYENAVQCSKEDMLRYLSKNNIQPFGYPPILTFLYQKPSINSFLMFDTDMQLKVKNNILNVQSLNEKMIKTLDGKLQSQILLLLQRCLIIFPFFDMKNISKKILEKLENMNINTCALSRFKIYEPHSKSFGMGLHLFSFILHFFF